MAYTFGDGFDCYAVPADAYAGYWDSGNSGGASLVAGRFTGSQCLQMQSSGIVYLLKNSGANDAVHHIVCAYRQTASLSGTLLPLYFQLSDGATNQVCIVFRSDGVILLTSATATGTVLATYSGAVTAANTWFAFEFEVVISPTVGRFRARKNGNTSDDFDSGATLNTRPGTNAYANRLTIGFNNTLSFQQIDDILWRSDASSVPFVGDIRCYTRLPASDVQAQFSRSPTTATQQTATKNSNSGVTSSAAYYTPPIVAAYDGTMPSLTVDCNAAYTGNIKCSLFSNNAGKPGTVLGSANMITNMIIGPNTITFPTPPTIVKGQTYFVGLCTDTPNTGPFSTNSATTGWTGGATYAGFPVANPTVSAYQALVITVTIGVGANSNLVSEAQQDGATTYVYDSNVGDNDLYAIAPLSGTPASTIAVTTRGFMEKSDAGTRNAAVQLKSGATTVQSPSTALSTSWGWLYRTDTTDPATGAAWTATAVNNAQIGPRVTL